MVRVSRQSKVKSSRVAVGYIYFYVFSEYIYLLSSVPRRQWKQFLPPAFFTSCAISGWILSIEINWVASFFLIYLFASPWPQVVKTADNQFTRLLSSRPLFFVLRAIWAFTNLRTVTGCRATLFPQTTTTCLHTQRLSNVSQIRFDPMPLTSGNFIS